MDERDRGSEERMGGGRDHWVGKTDFSSFRKRGGIGRGGGGQSDFFFLSSDLEIERGGGWL